MTLRHRIEAAALRAGIRLCRRLGPVAASNFGGWVMRTLGPLLPASRTADHNLRLALPHLSARERAVVVRGVWDNLGRVAGELPHLAALHESADGPGWEIADEAHVQPFRAHGPAIFFSAHFGNWELIGPAMAALGIPLAGVYRAASNPLTDRLIQDLRREARGGDVPMFPKGSAGARAALAHLASGGALGMMMDQKMNDGIAVDFFGRPAMTAPALAHFALRFECPVVPVHIERLGPARFRVVCEAPLPLPATGDRAADTEALMRAVNATIEGWIRAEPQSWFWLHRRWPREQNAETPH